MSRLLNKFFVVPAIIIFAVITGCSQQTEEKYLAKKIAEYMDSHPGLHVGYRFHHDGEIIAEGAAGMSDIESQKILEAHNPIPIASGTKPFTAAAIFRLQDKGKMNIEDTISKIFPAEHALWQGKIPAWADKVQVKHLLNHTSGLAEYLANHMVDLSNPHNEINMGIIRFAAINELSFEPGTQYNYNNTGYVMAGLIIEEVSGQTLAEFLQAEFFGPLDLEQTHMASLKQAIDYQTGKNTDYPTRYFLQVVDGKPKYIKVGPEIVLSPFADGGMISTTKEMVDWNLALHGGKVLSAESYKLMTTPTIKADTSWGHDSYIGYGMYITKLGDAIVYEHAGNAYGIRAEYGYVPEINFAYAIVSNAIYTGDKGLDFSKPENQVDIVFLRDHAVRSFVPYAREQAAKASK